MALRPLDARSIADHVRDELRDAIHAGRLAPGERLVEHRLAAELGVSHIPVREALSRLADEGLVEHLPRRGSRVAGLSAEDLREICSLRTLLEQEVAARASSRLTSRDEALLRRLATSMCRAAQRRDTGRVHDLDRRSHERLLELSGHRLLAEQAAQLRSRTSGVLRAADAVLGVAGLEAHAGSHQRLVDAVAGGEARPARRAAARHVELIGERVRRAGFLISSGT